MEHTIGETYEVGGMFRAYRGAFAPSDLAVVNAWPPEEWDESEHAGETWANWLCDTARGQGNLYAPDLEGTTFGDPDGIRVLIRACDLPSWQGAAHDLGIELQLREKPITAGHYGDGNWLGVELVEENGRLLWFE